MKDLSSQPVCDACHVDARMEMGRRPGYRAEKCHACGLVHTVPVPTLDELKAFYDGFAFLPPKISAIETDLESIRHSLEFHLGARDARTQFLDYGGGYGLYAKAARQLGWEVSLFDFDPGALKFAKDELGVADCVESLDQLEGKTFDVIWAFHVIEHWRNLEESFFEMAHLLKPGGMIVVATPNARSWEKYFRFGHFRNYLRSWKSGGAGGLEALLLLLRYDSVFCWDPPRHLYAFTPASLKKFGFRVGYNVEVRVGSNLDPRFEPRRYVMGDPGNRRRGLLTGLKRRPWSPGIWCSLALLLFETLGFKVGGAVAQEGGEQLYAIFQKKS